jgi:hypothetical protein
MAKYTHVTDDISPEQREKWQRKRRREDRIEALADGFTLVAHGRGGFIYYREAGKILELFWEMSGVPEFDILLNTFGLGNWVWPSSEPVSPADRSRIHDALASWLKQVGYRAQLLETAP